MAKKSSNSALTALVVGVILILLGLIVLGMSLILNDGDPDTALTYDIMMYASIGVAVIGVIMTVAAIVIGKSGSSKSKKSQPQAQQMEAEHMGDVEIQLDGSTMYNGQAVEYIPSQEAYEFVNVGKRQSNDDKFDQIGKMGKTQFVIYLAKLFSMKGYEVQLTPVMENHDVDMLVKKDGTTRAVGCLLSNKVLCAQDVKCVHEGKAFYKADGSMAVTNMYFDRTSLDFAKSHDMTLIDRNILAEQFMN